MRIEDQVAAVDSYRARIASASWRLAWIYSRLGTAPEGVSVQSHAKAIEESHLQSIDESAYAGSMSWLEAADVVTDIIETAARGGHSGTEQ